MLRVRSVRHAAAPGMACLHAKMVDRLSADTRTAAHPLRRAACNTPHLPGHPMCRQTIFTMRAGVYSRWNGVVVAASELVMFALPFAGGRSLPGCLVGWVEVETSLPRNRCPFVSRNPCPPACSDPVPPEFLLWQPSAVVWHRNQVRACWRRGWLQPSLDLWPDGGCKLPSAVARGSPH